MQGAFAGPHALALFFTTNTPYLCRSKQLAHCTLMYYTKGKKFFLASYTFWFFHPDYQQITQCKMISKHLTLSYTTSYTILHCSLHYLTPHITLSYTASYTHICHSINTSSGDGHAATAIRNAGIGGAESLMLRLIFLPPVGELALSRNAFSLLHGIWCASGVQDGFLLSYTA